MTSDPCREMRPLLGAAALGGLEPAEEIALRAHLDGCAPCRAELRELTSVARALPLTDPTRRGAALPAPAPDLGERVLGRLARERAARRLRFRRRVEVAAAAVLVAAAASIALVVALSGPGAGGTKIVFHEPAPVEASATLHTHAAGTQVAFHVAGLHPGAYYWLWLTGADGDRIAAGTFQGSARALDLTMTAAIPLRDTRRIWVTDAANDVVLDAAVSPG